MADNLLGRGEIKNLPLISICIPTFNRASHLNGLLKNISLVIAGFDQEVEICISNNASTDLTREIIQSYSSIINLSVITQSKNIGATLNAIEVTKLATGRWILIVGDDDEFYCDGLRMLLSSLKEADVDEWILVGVTDSMGENNLLKNLECRVYSCKEFRLELIKKSLFPFGFIGMHVFPSSLRNTLLNLKPDECRPWPHLALLFRHLVAGKFRVHLPPVIAQAKGGGALFWSIGDWIIADTSKMHILSYSFAKITSMKFFFLLAILRELYSTRGIQELILWKLLEPKDFRLRAVSTYTSCYRLLGPTFIFSGMHALIMVGLFFSPNFLVAWLFDVLGKGYISENYKKEKKNKLEFDGVHRGL